MRFVEVAFAILVVIGVGCIAGGIIIGSGLLNAPPPPEPKGLRNLEIELPENYSISSWTAIDKTLVLCCWNDSQWDFALFTFRVGDEKLVEHPIDIIPYQGLRTSLHVIDGKLFLFYTRDITDVAGSSYQSFVHQVDTDSWTLREPKKLDLPNHLAPGVQASDGKDLYILGGVASENGNWPFYHYDGVYKVEIGTGECQLIAQVDNISSMNGVFNGDRLVLIRRDGDWSGGAETNFGTAGSWNATMIFLPESNTTITSEDRLTLSSYGPVPAVDSALAYYFATAWFNQTTQQWEPASKVWTMDENGSVSELNITLPWELGYIAPLWLGDRFILLSMTGYETTLWSLRI